MIVAHDPGHGAPPAVLGVCKNGIVERDVVLSIAQDIAAGIPWVQHLLVRSKPIGLLDYDRAQNAHRAGADLAICHHINEDSDPASHGLIAFYKPEDKIGCAVANAIANVAPAPLLRDHGYRAYAAKPDDWTNRALWCINHYRLVGIPCVLIEWGFASYKPDADYLLDPTHRPAMVSCVMAGLACAMELLNKPGEVLACNPKPEVES